MLVNVSKNRRIKVLGGGQCYRVEEYSKRKGYSDDVPTWHDVYETWNVNCLIRDYKLSKRIIEELKNA